MVKVIMRYRFVAFFFIIIIVCLLNGCAIHGSSSERIADQSFTSKIEPGKTTHKEIRETFGYPFTRKVSNNGEQEWEYRYAKLRATHFNPWGAKTFDVFTLIIRFDRNGVVKEYVTGSSKKSNLEF